MSTYEKTVLTTPDGAEIGVHAWTVSEPRGVVQVTHGMGEHALRYAELATALNGHGWSVVAQDHRGHGTSAASPDLLGVLGADGWDRLVTDIGAVRAHAGQLAPGRPVVLFGHSMGSFAVQQFLPDHAAEIDAVILTGTAALDLLEPALDLDAELDLAMFNAPFAPARTDFDWLSRDPERVDAYVADPMTGFGLDVEATKALFAGARDLADPLSAVRIPRALPVLIAVGGADPINAGLALVRPLVERYAAAGMSRVELRTYPGARHELTNETNRDEFTADLLSWLDQQLPA